MPVITQLDPLDKNALRLILTEPRNALIKQYIKLFQLDGIKLTFDKAAINLIVEKALTYNLGARGLRSICEAIMLEAMFKYPSEKSKKNLIITANYVKKKLDILSVSDLRVA